MIKWLPQGPLDTKDARPRMVVYIGFRVEGLGCRDYRILQRVHREVVRGVVSHVSDDTPDRLEAKSARSRRRRMTERNMTCQSPTGPSEFPKSTSCDFPSRICSE